MPDGNANSSTTDSASTPAPAVPPPGRVNVLLIGGGGREHALALRLAASPRLGTLYTTHPDNPGLAALAKPVGVPVSIREIYRLQQFIEKNDIGLVVIGPEDPLAEGFADKLASPKTLVFGPTKAAAQIEADKAFSKQLMRSASIPTADSQAFTTFQSARAYIEGRVRDENLLRALLGMPREFDTHDDMRKYVETRIGEVVARVPALNNPASTQQARARAVLSAAISASETFRDPADRIKYMDNLRDASAILRQACNTPLDSMPVVKAAGLAKGKGVFLPNTFADAIATLDRIMIKKEFGDAGNTVIIEERLEGPEVSVLAIVDGRNILVLPPCQDHKRLLDGDQGPNTGGMGAFCPADTIDDALMARIEREVLVPTVDALRREGVEYKGVLYAGLMLTPAGPRVLEFNCRFGDPECQPLMARLKTDLLEIMLAACEGRLDQIDVEWDPRPALCVVIAAKGYPDKPLAGAIINGIDGAEDVPTVKVYHASTRRSGADVVTAGGRVLGVTALGDTLEEARVRAYEACAAITFDGMQYRHDIAATAASSGGAGSAGPAKKRAAKSRQ